MRDLIAAGILAAAAHFTSGCQPCDRDGCEKVNERASSDGTSAIAGALASESDVEANGCTECPLASAQLSIWSTPALVSDQAEALAVVSAGPATFSLSAQGSYRQAVPPGAYLLCERECVAVAVEPGMVTTVNILFVYGPTSFRVFDAGATTWRRAQSFAITR